MSETLSSVPTAHANNVELAKFANKTASFFCEIFQTESGEIAKIVRVIVKRSESNKALATVRYFLDIAPAKVLFHDLWLGALHNDHSEYKVLHGTERSLKIAPLDGGAYRFSLMNKSDGEAESLYFDLSRFQTRCLARTVLDYLQAWQIGSAIYKRKGRIYDAKIDNSP